jgi:nuclear transport factor 2 (NTF2) superfamily protein
MSDGLASGLGQHLFDAIFWAVRKSNSANLIDGSYQRSEKEILKERQAMNPPQAQRLVPPFTYETAVLKVRKAEDSWNSREPAKVALGYSENSYWRNRAEFVQGRKDIVAFLTRKWQRELEYRLIKELWAFGGPRIAVRFAYEWRDDSGNWYRSYGNENWEYDEQGLNHHRYACINDLLIKESDRKFRWPQGRRPDDHPGLSDLGL